MFARQARSLARTLQERSSAVALRQSELVKAWAQSPLIQAVLSSTGSIVRVTDLAAIRTGVANDQTVGRPLWHAEWWLDEGTRMQAESAVRHVAATGEPRSWTAAFRGSQGVPRQGHFTLRRIRRANGALDLMHLVVRDATEEERLRNALDQGERRYQALLANLPGAVFRAHGERPWRTLYLSEGIRRLSGFAVDFFLKDGHPFESIILEEDRAHVAETLAGQAAAGQPLRCEYRIRCRDGSVRWVEAHARPAEDDPSLIEGTVLDVDARKRAQIALDESQAQFHYITQHSPSVLWTAQPDGSIDFISDAHLTQFGRASSDLLGSRWQALLHPGDVERVRKRWAESLAAGAPYDIRYRLRDPDGRYLTYQANGRCRRDAAGEITRWYGVLTNVDELVRTQAQLRESEALARVTLETIPGVVWRARCDGYVDFVSDACAAQLGWTPLELITGQWASLLHPDEIEAVSLRYQRSLDTGCDFSSRHRFRCADGRYQWFQVHATAQREPDGSVLRWHGLATCIEELLQARLKAESAVRAKSTFLSTMSHEIRTPLNAVLGFAHLLEESTLDAPQRECVRAIQSSGRHLLGVINDILDLSKMESGGVLLDFAPCELRGLVESALDLVAGQSAAKHLDLSCGFEEGLPIAVTVDGGRLRQVLVNLLGNAVKFTERGEVHVQVGAKPLPGEEIELIFTVRDTGPGLSLAAQNRLFTEFSQGDDSVSRRFGGTGLGLAISKRLVEAHGGTISVVSTSGRGSTFCIRIPAGICDPGTVETPAPVPALRGRRVLVVDDHRPTLQTLGEHLREWGVEATLVADPCTASVTAERAAARGCPYEVALVDQRMQERDGIAVAREIKAAMNVPVVLLCERDGRIGAQEAGADCVVAVQAKPLHRAALRDVLLQALRLTPSAPDALAARSAS